MTDAEFIDLCYQRILGRPAEDSAKNSLLAALASRTTTRDSFLEEILLSPEFEAQYRCREAFPSGHFFSALPSAEARAGYVRDTKCESVPGIDLRIDGQMNLAREFASYFGDCPLVKKREATKRYFAENFSFPFSDAFILYGFIRRFSPRKIVEIGSGYSSAAILDSLDDLAMDQTQCWFVEPYPELLRSLIRDQDARHEILPLPVQDVDTRLFETLDSGDILFIDSTHVSKVNSDVNRELFEILPRLKPGVLVHIHDIYWPFDYPQEWIREGRAWNEAYLVRAFLQFNEAFRIRYFNSYVHPRFRDLVFTPLGVDIGENDGGSLWIEKA